MNTALFPTFVPRITYRVIFQPACSPHLNPRDTWAWNAIKRELSAVRNRISLKAEAGCCALGNSLSGCRDWEEHPASLFRRQPGYEDGRVRDVLSKRQSWPTGSGQGQARASAHAEKALTVRNPRTASETRGQTTIPPGWISLPGLHQDITLAESVAFLWVPAARQCAGRFVLHGLSLNVHRYWTRGPKYSTRRQVICASTWRWIWEHVDEIGTHLVQVEWVKGHPTMQLVQAGTTSLWQLHAKELADEQAKKGSALHPIVAQVEQSHSARTSFLGWLAKFLGRLHRQRWRFRAHVSRLGRSVNGKYLQKHIHTTRTLKR